MRTILTPIRFTMCIFQIVKISDSGGILEFWGQLTNFQPKHTADKPQMFGVRR